MARMKLYYSPNSPYARKVRVLLIERDMTGQVELVAVDTAEVYGPLAAVNPLGKVPVLDAGDDGLIQDSPVICEYLDGHITSDRHDGKPVRLADKKLAAMAHGMLDAGYAVRMEKARPEDLQWQAWKDKQFGKINRALDQFESDVASLPKGADIGSIALACALQWLEFRLPEGDWLAQRSGLKQWADEFGRRPSMQQTRPA